ncbi:MAG: PEGA domain-containing protein [Steroidobacteraceae bacterium]
MIGAETGADARPGEAGISARIAVAEPQGERIFERRLAIGGEGAEVVVPGSPAGALLWIERRETAWTAQALDGANVAFDGRVLAGARALRQGDVLAVGRAQIVVAALTRSELHLDVRHVVGNATVSPASTLAAPDLDDDDVEIVPEPAGPEAAMLRGRAASRRHWTWAAPVIALLALAAYVSGFEPLAIVVQPSDAYVGASDTWLALRSGDQIFLRRGRHVLDAERKGYAPARVGVLVRSGSAGAAPVRLVLRKLPGRLKIDTGGVEAAVSVDGVRIGSAPGEMEVAAGRRTIALRAPRYLDYIATLDVAGAGALQSLKARLQPSWGTLAISVSPPGAQLSIDGREQTPAPATLQLDAGVHLVRLTSPGLKAWESRIVIEAGETLRAGTITLGQPDAQLAIRSDPEGADVSVARTFRGRTPLVLSLPAGIEHEVRLSLPGYESWARTVLAEPARRLTLAARLKPIFFEVSVRGVPAGAEIRVDGAPRGRAPHAFELLAVEHRIEVRQPGFVPLVADVSPTPGLASTVEYHLAVGDRSVLLQQSAPIITTKAGYVLRIVPSGVFLMGGDSDQRLETIEGSRTVKLARPFYIGVREVTNAEFGEFRPERTTGQPGDSSRSSGSGASDPRAPVTGVSWDDAVEYCNWLSHRDGLEPAYHRRGGTYALRVPVTDGYRLPTEAEWEYAARRLLPGGSGAYLESGNISEWVNDFYQPSVDGAPATDPLGPHDGVRHVVRAWRGPAPAGAAQRTVWRDGGDGASVAVGFRIARYAE